MTKLEDKLLLTNKSKGKGAILAGNVLMVAGLITPVGTCAYSLFALSQVSVLDPASLIAGGAIVGAGLITKTYGKIKHWYYNR
ncbi:hypothetical protein A3K82_01445 [Candidatus Pacearchaeota archaeon RBG_19FT_COMBO_34_9]|nr:MAG: hypothetical protein A3K82_01445 [Candidatus Pacearchaeota archaeon RBG_19FT_COMBO_34_9]OGJ16932.1 MAG: hypothetical protein A3K74_02235 [Candidatus Pacearchaeota archaeon RBG_13_33_26]